MSTELISFRCRFPEEELALDADFFGFLVSAAVVNSISSFSSVSFSGNTGDTWSSSIFTSSRDPLPEVPIHYIHLLYFLLVLLAPVQTFLQIINLRFAFIVLVLDQIASTLEACQSIIQEDVSKKI